MEEAWFTKVCLGLVVQVYFFHVVEPRTSAKPRQLKYTPQDNLDQKRDDPALQKPTARDCTMGHGCGLKSEEELELLQEL